MSSYVLDTNIVIKALEGHEIIRNLLQDADLYISFVSEIELLSWPSLNSESEEAVNQFLNQVKIIELTSSIKQLVIDYRRRYKLKLADAFVIATSVFLNYTLLTTDTDFQKVAELSSVQII